MSENSQLCLVALGGNMPSQARDSREILPAAAAELGVRLGTQVQLSPLYRTPAFPAGSGPDFTNAACRFLYSGSAEALLETLHEVEAAFGRKRSARWGQRTLDLDLIACGQMVWPDAQTYAKWHDLPLEDQVRHAPGRLILPHPRLQDRAFVLVPLADIAPDWVHPVLGRTVVQMRDSCAIQDRADVVRL